MVSYKRIHPPGEVLVGPPARNSLSCAALFLLCCPSRVFADKLQITSNPPGATVELDGVAVGATPFEKDFPGGYFHKTRTSMGSRLEHPVVARISLSGYATRECKLTEGAMNWISLNGRNRGEYWLLKSDHFHGQHHRQSLRRRRRLQPELSLEELVRQAKPAIVYLKGLESSGSGFFVTGTGVIVTNAHLACGEETLLTLLSNGQQLEAKVLHIDSDLDIALAKVERPAGKSDFPHLTLADASSVRQDENVWPSAIRANSGGPLLNSCGEVIAINTQKLIKKNVTGMGFALSASDLLEVLHRFHPNAMPLTENSPPASQQAAQTAGQPLASEGAESSDSSKISSSSAPDGVGTVTVSSDPDGAEIFIDDKFLGNAPATLKLPLVSHAVLLKFPGHAYWRRTLEILKSSKVSLKATLEPIS